MKEFDLVVIGAGSGGVRSARWSAGLGAKVAIIEKAQFGGTCVIRGCVPKKMMALASHFSTEVEAMKNYGWTTSAPQFDWKVLKTNRDAEIQRLEKIYKDLLTKSGVEVFEGAARILKAGQVEVNGEVLAAKNIIIATGARPLVADIPGKEWLKTSDDFFLQEEQPKRVVIVGAGYIGVELASIYNGLGSEVHLVARSSKVLNRFDCEVSDFLTERLKAHGVNLHLNSELHALNKHAQGFEVEISGNNKIHADVVHITVGRRPNTQHLNLVETGVELHADGRVKVDKNMQTTVPGIYALGDVANKLNLTPVATGEGMWLAEFLFGKKPDAAFDYSNIPTAVFSEPPLSTVGLTEEQCKSQGIEYKCFKSSFRPLKHTISKLEEKTFMKLIVDQKTDKVLGCHMVGDDAPEIMQGFAVAVKMGATKKDFDRTIGIHPSSAEEFVTLRG